MTNNATCRLARYHTVALSKKIEIYQEIFIKAE